MEMPTPHLSPHFSPPPFSSARSLVQPHAESFQKECDIDPKYITNFSEEVVRGHSVFVLGCATDGGKRGRFAVGLPFA